MLKHSGVLTILFMISKNPSCTTVTNSCVMCKLCTTLKCFASAQIVSHFSSTQTKTCSQAYRIGGHTMSDKLNVITRDVLHLRLSCTAPAAVHGRCWTHSFHQACLQGCIIVSCCVTCMPGKPTCCNMDQELWQSCRHSHSEV